jgi:hypothetical protein
MSPDARPGQAYSAQVFPTRKSTFVVVLALLVVAGVLGLGAYLATAADILIWLLCALLVAALVRLIWRRAPQLAVAASRGPAFRNDP